MSHKRTTETIRKSKMASNHHDTFDKQKWIVYTLQLDYQLDDVAYVGENGSISITHTL